MDRLGGECQVGRSGSTRLSLGGSGGVTGAVGGRVGSVNAWSSRGGGITCRPDLTPVVRTSKEREIRLLTDTDGRGVRVERGRHGLVGCKVVNATIPGFFMKKRFPMGGWWSETEGGCLFLCLQFGRFTQGAEKSARKPKSPKSPLEKIVVR